MTLSCTGRVIATATEIRELGELVRDADPDRAVTGVPSLMLLEDAGPVGPRVWCVNAVLSNDPGGPPNVWMSGGSHREYAEWNTSRVTDTQIAGHGPWVVVWADRVDVEKPAVKDEVP